MSSSLFLACNVHCHFLLFLQLLSVRYKSEISVERCICNTDMGLNRNTNWLLNACADMVSLCISIPVGGGREKWHRPGAAIFDFDIC